jgi:hypothetical protein
VSAIAIDLPCSARGGPPRAALPAQGALPRIASLLTDTLGVSGWALRGPRGRERGPEKGCRGGREHSLRFHPTYPPPFPPRLPPLRSPPFSSLHPHVPHVISHSPVTAGGPAADRRTPPPLPVSTTRAPQTKAAPQQPQSSDPYAFQAFSDEDDDGPKVAALKGKEQAAGAEVEAAAGAEVEAKAGAQVVSPEARAAALERLRAAAMEHRPARPSPPERPSSSSGPCSSSAGRSETDK